MKRFALALLSTFQIYGYAQESFNPDLERVALKNIRQITFPTMGFEKAGEAYFSPDGKSILFQAVPLGKEQYQIFAMNFEEKIPHMVSTGRGACTCAYFRPDGKKIIFASSHDDPRLHNGSCQTAKPGYKREGGTYSWEFTSYMNIYEANPDGSELRPLTSGPCYTAECAYSSDGTHIVFASNRSGSMNIYTMKADGSDVRAVTNTTTSYNGGPFFSPDGSQIVFRADRDKPHYLQIYVTNVDGSEEVQVTNNNAVNWSPYWHPSGGVVAFTTSLHGHMHYEIYLLHVKTGRQYRLTHNSTFDGLPVFNKKGTQLMWTSKRGPDNTSQIFLADFVLPKLQYFKNLK
jgi:TolB protein